MKNFALYRIIIILILTKASAGPSNLSPCKVKREYLIKSNINQMIYEVRRLIHESLLSLPANKTASTQRDKKPNKRIKTNFWRPLLFNYQGTTGAITPITPVYKTQFIPIKRDNVKSLNVPVEQRDTISGINFQHAEHMNNTRTLILNSEELNHLLSFINNLVYNRPPKEHINLLINFLSLKVNHLNLADIYQNETDKRTNLMLKEILQNIISELERNYSFSPRQSFSLSA